MISGRIRSLARNRKLAQLHIRKDQQLRNRMLAQVHIRNPNRSKSLHACRTICSGGRTSSCFRNRCRNRKRELQ